jgi:hypothetical protein
LHPLRYGTIVLTAFAFLSVGSLASASELTKEGAQQAIAECLNGNGSPQVTEIHASQGGASVDVQLTDYKYAKPDGTIAKVSGAGQAEFMVYEEQPWMLRSFRFPDGSRAACHDIKVKPQE